MIGQGADFLSSAEEQLGDVFAGKAKCSSYNIEFLLHFC